MCQKISIIVAMDEAGGIGKKNALLCHLPADLKYFKEMTRHKPIVMGRKTYESIGRPLPERENIVLSRTLQSSPGIRVVTSIEDVLKLMGPEVMIIGGAEIFELFLPRVTHLYVTRIHHRFEADVFFPALDESQWQIEAKTLYMKDEKNPYHLTFEIQKRVDKE